MHIDDYVSSKLAGCSIPSNIQLAVTHRLTRENIDIYQLTTAPGEDEPQPM